MALAAYRQLLRSTRIAFQGIPTICDTCDSNYNYECLTRAIISAGDLRILSAARVEARSKFERDRFLSPSSTDAEQKVLEAKEVARILRQNVVQGEQVTGAENEEQRYRA